MRGYSQKQLAMLLGLRARKAISELERGRRLPPATVAMLLEIVLGTKLSEIYPEWYRELGEQAVHREDRLPDRFTRHIKGRVLGKD
jgi:transcriptional regulator with XRE-family HTH domain